MKGNSSHLHIHRVAFTRSLDHLKTSGYLTSFLGGYINTIAWRKYVYFETILSSAHPIPQLTTPVICHLPSTRQTSGPPESP